MTLPTVTPRNLAVQALRVIASSRNQHTNRVRTAETVLDWTATVLQAGDNQPRKLADVFEYWPTAALWATEGN